MPRLDVRIIAARNLPDPQLLGKPDPYVKLALEHQQHKTSVCENQINPKWDEVFKFQIADENSSQLKLELWNSNMMKDDYLGQYVLSLSGLQRGVVRDEWLLLQQCKTNSEIHVKILAIDFGILPPAGTPTFTDTNGAPAAGYAPAPAVAPVPVAPAPAPQYAPQQQPQYAPQQPQQPQYAPQQQPQYARPPQQPQYAPQQPQYVPPPPQQPQYAAPQGYPPQPYGAGPAPGMMPPQHHHHHHHHQQMAPGYPQAQGYPQQGPGYQARPGYPQGPGFQAQPGYPSYGY